MVAQIRPPPSFGDRVSNNYRDRGNRSGGSGANSFARGISNGSRPPNAKSSPSPSFSNGSSLAVDYSSPNKVICQICQQFGHNALDCYHHMNYAFQGRHPLAQLAAMAATSNAGAPSATSSSASPSPFWLSDSSCNAHLTADLGNLSVS